MMLWLLLLYGVAHQVGVSAPQWRRGNLETNTVDGLGIESESRLFWGKQFLMVRRRPFVDCGPYEDRPCGEEVAWSENQLPV